MRAPPADVSPVQNEPATIPTLDGWIESLMSCKQLAEADVQRLCDKVSHVLEELDTKNSRLNLHDEMGFAA